MIVPDKLTEKDSDVSDILKMKEHSETLERYRDVIKKNIPFSIGMCIGAITNHKQILRDAEQEGEMNMCRALEELEEKGRMEGRNTILENMIRNGLAAEEIARYAGVALEEVWQVQKNIVEKMQTVSA